MVHRKKTHPKTYKCTECDLLFPNSFDLEKHMMTIHNSETPYACDLCNAKFVVEWRYLKHKNSHNDITTKTCHYYNNGKPCPYELQGCKFSHKTSRLCLIGQKSRQA